LIDDARSEITAESVVLGIVVVLPLLPVASSAHMNSNVASRRIARNFQRFMLQYHQSFKISFTLKYGDR
jgi:hypothetical protein